MFCEIEGEPGADNRLPNGLAEYEVALKEGDGTQQGKAEKPTDSDAIVLGAADDIGEEIVEGKLEETQVGSVSSTPV